MSFIHNTHSMRQKNMVALSAELRLKFDDTVKIKEGGVLRKLKTMSINNFCRQLLDNAVSIKSSLCFSSNLRNKLDSCSSIYKVDMKDSIDNECNNLRSQASSRHPKKEVLATPSSNIVINDVKMTIKEFIEKSLNHNVVSYDPLDQDYDYENYVVQNLRKIKMLSPIFDTSYYIKKLEHASKIFKEKADEPGDSLKPWIAIDLDETLIHSELLIEGEEEKYDLTIPSIEYGVFIRPFLIEFLTSLSNYFNLCLFTAAETTYTSAVIDALKIGRFFKRILSREFCIDLDRLLYVKDLSIFDNHAEVLIIENSMLSFSRDLKNGVLVSSYYNDKNDTELLDLLDYLMGILKESRSANDVTEVNSKNLTHENEKHFFFSSIYQSLDI